MTYIGQQPATTFDAGIQDRFTGLSSNTVTLTHEIAAEEDILVVWNNIVQDKNTYSVGGTGNKTLTLGGTLVSADVVTVYYLNKVMQSVNPTAGSVNTTQLADDAVSLAKLSATGTPSSSNFLRGDNSWASAGLSDWSENSGNLLPSNASYGIYLGVNSATATNLLHDYEEGELSNALMIASTTQTSYSSGRANLQYTKIGRIVHCQALIDTDGQTLATTGVVKLRLPFAVSDGSGTAMAGGTPFLSPSVNGDVYPSRLYMDENVTSAPFNKMQCQASGSYLQFGEQLQVSNTAHRIYIHACFSYQTDA